MNIPVLYVTADFCWLSKKRCFLPRHPPPPHNRAHAHTYTHLSLCIALKSRAQYETYKSKIVFNIVCWLRFYRTLVIPVHGIKTCGGTGGIAPLILNLGARWRLVVSFPPWPLYSLCLQYTRRRLKMGTSQFMEVWWNRNAFTCCK